MAPIKFNNQISEDPSFGPELRNIKFISKKLLYKEDHSLFIEKQNEALLYKKSHAVIRHLKMLCGDITPHNEMW